MTRKNVLKGIVALAGAVVVGWVVHVLGLTSNDPSCFARGEFWGCVSDRMRATRSLLN
jgi:hypothetical protein